MKQTRYTRLRDQRSPLWRKRRRYAKERIRAGKIQARNTTKIKGGPDVDTSLKSGLGLWGRILAGVAMMNAQQRKEPKQNYQQAQAR